MRTLLLKIKVIILLLKIWDWHQGKFADWNFDDQKKKFTAEVYEFMSAMESYTTSKNSAKKLRHVYEEMADILIAGANLLKYHQGYSTVKYKFIEVKRRKYGKDGQHKA